MLKMTENRTPGSEGFPFILKSPINKDSLIAKYHDLENATQFSDMHSPISSRRYIDNVLSNRSLSNYEIYLCIWLRLNLTRYEDIIEVDENRSKQQFPRIGVRVKANLDEPSDEFEPIPERYSEIIDQCKIKIEEGQIALYTYLMDRVSKRDLEYIYNTIYASDENPAFDISLRNKEKISESIVDYFADERRHDHTLSFLEMVETYWSRSELFDFGNDVLLMDEEEREYFSKCSHDEMIEFLRQFYCDADIVGDEQTDDSWSVHFLTTHEKIAIRHSLSYRLFRDGPPAFLNAGKIHNIISSGIFDSKFFLSALERLDRYGYIRVSPLDTVEHDGQDPDLLHKFRVEKSDKKTKIDSIVTPVRFYYHIRIFNLMSMKDYSESWDDIISGKKHSEVVKNRMELNKALRPNRSQNTQNRNSK